MVFDDKKATLVQQSQVTSQLSEVLYKCLACKKTFKTNEQLEQHKKSKNHKKSEKAYIELHPDAPLSSMFDNITTDKPLMGSVLGLLSQQSDKREVEEDVSVEIKTDKDGLPIDDS